MAKPTRQLRGLRTLVTGASSGIGRATSAALASRGATVVGSGRDPAALAAGSREEGGPFTATIVRDLTEPGAPSAVVGAAADALGGLDLVVSCAGAGWSGPFQEMTPSDIDALLDINLKASVLVAHAAASYLRSSDARGQLVLVGSIAGLLGVAEEAVYSATKAGLRGLADALRAEWYPVTVTLVSPGAVSTPFFTRRNRPYTRSWPKPINVSRAADAIVDAIQRRREEVIVPRWLVLPARLNGGCPALYSKLARRWA
ncbi:MAG: SDR family NAD(P)-dependent oxidoreductase [Acidimicrobiales bacterium]